MTRALLAVAGAALLGGCASVNPQPAFTDVATSVRERSGQTPAWARNPQEADAAARTVADLLRGELTADAAVRIALLNNRSLQATFEEVGLSQADLAQATRLQNPELFASVRFPSEGSGRNSELALVLNVFDVFLLPSRQKLAAAEMEQTKLRVAAEVLRLAAEVKEAFFTLQARQQLVAGLGLIRDLTETAADFARRQHEAGTINDLELENRLVLFRQARADVAVEEAEVASDRERLNRLLGLWGKETEWRVLRPLPDLPKDELPLEGLERTAVSQRQDLQAARWGVDVVGRALALKKKTRFFPIGVNVGIDTEKDVTGQRLTGPELTLQLPIFDTGKASIARLEAEHRRAQRQLEALAVDARSEVRESRERMLSARDLARYYGEVLLPQRARILELTLQQYNAMLKGAYDLLLAKQAEVETQRAFFEAWRDYWIWRARLERAVGGALPGAPAPRPGGEEGRS